MTDEEPSENPSTGAFAARLAKVFSIVAPTTAVTALLVYIGYVSVQERFLYFGIQLDLVDLPTRQLLLYGSEVAFLAVVVLLLAAGLGAGLYLAGKRLVAGPRREPLARRAGLVLLCLGVPLLIRGFLGAFVSPWPFPETTWVTPLALVLGALAVRWSLWFQQEGAALQEPPGRLSPEVVNVIRFLLLIVLVAGLFQLGNRAAIEYGRHEAHNVASKLQYRPSIILYTQKELEATPTGITYDKLEKGRTYRYQYTGWALLARSGNVLFLAPAPWSPDESTVLVIEHSPDIRLHIIPPSAG